MNERIQELAREAGFKVDWQHEDVQAIKMERFERFAELIKQAIYDEIKEELVPEEHIDDQPDIEDRCYLRGNNGGIIDALCIVKNFGVDINE